MVRCIRIRSHEFVEPRTTSEETGRTNQSALLIILDKVTDVVRDELIYIEKTQKVREKLRDIVENGLAELQVDPAVASLSNEDEISSNLRLAESLFIVT